MEENIHTLTNTDIHILECGLGWIKEAEHTFGQKLFHRLLRDDSEINAALNSIGLPAFSSHIVQSLEEIIGELRSCGRILFPLRKEWGELSPTTGRPFDSEQFSRIAETFLDVLSELAEDAWSPTMEFAWRKAIHQVSIQLWGQQPESWSLSTLLSRFEFIKRRKHGMGQPLVLFLGTCMILAGGIASISLWSRCRLAEMKLQRNPSLKKAWCS